MTGAENTGDQAVSVLETVPPVLDRYSALAQRLAALVLPLLSS